MNRPLIALDAEALLRRVAERVPHSLRRNVVVIGSIATAWAFRDVARTAMVATKDIDLLLQPSVDAVSTAEALGAQLLSEGWTPRFPNAAQPGTSSTPDQDLPALRLAPPDNQDGWFVELLAEACVFRPKPATDSDASRPPIPIDVGHRFRAMPARIPGKSATLPTMSATPGVRT